MSNKFEPTFSFSLNVEFGKWEHLLTSEVRAYLQDKKKTKNILVQNLANLYEFYEGKFYHFQGLTKVKINEKNRKVYEEIAQEAIDKNKDQFKVLDYVIDDISTNQSTHKITFLYVDTKNLNLMNIYIIPLVGHAVEQIKSTMKEDLFQ